MPAALCLLSPLSVFHKKLAIAPLAHRKHRSMKHWRAPSFRATKHGKKRDWRAKDELCQRRAWSALYLRRVQFALIGGEEKTGPRVATVERQIALTSQIQL